MSKIILFVLFFSQIAFCKRLRHFLKLYKYECKGLYGQRGPSFTSVFSPLHTQNPSSEMVHSVPGVPAAPSVPFLPLVMLKVWPFMGIASLVLTARVGSAAATTATGTEFTVITGLLLGGVSIRGGEGKINGCIAGILSVSYTHLNESIKTISRMVGYPDDKYFARIFKKYVDDGDISTCDAFNAGN